MQFVLSPLIDIKILTEIPLIIQRTGLTIHSFVAKFVIASFAQNEQNRYAI